MTEKLLDYLRRKYLGWRSGRVGQWHEEPDFNPSRRIKVTEVVPAAFGDIPDGIDWYGEPDPPETTPMRCEVVRHQGSEEFTASEEV